MRERVRNGIDLPHRRPHHHVDANRVSNARHWLVRVASAGEYRSRLQFVIRPSRRFCCRGRLPRACSSTICIGGATHRSKCRRQTTHRADDHSGNLCTGRQIDRSSGRSADRGVLIVVVVIVGRVVLLVVDQCACHGIDRNSRQSSHRMRALVDATAVRRRPTHVRRGGRRVVDTSWLTPDAHSRSNDAMPSRQECTD
jgi:hypothetical protein